MTVTLATLLRARTQAEARDALLAALASAGFPVTSWRSGGVARTLVEVFGAGTLEAWNLAAALARGMLLDYASGDFLTALAKSHYGLDRIPAGYASGYVHLDATGVGPYPVPAAGLVVSDGTRYYRSTNATTLTLAASGVLDVPVKAEAAGAIYNQPTLNVLVSPALPGVTLTSPAYGGGSTWRTTDGRDEETDAQLRQRCRDRWASLGGFSRAAVRYYATSATFTDGSSVGCTRVAFGEPDGAGNYTVYLASSSGPLGAGGVSRIQQILTERAPITDGPTASGASLYSLPIVGTVRFRAGLNTTANQTAVTDGIAAFVNALDVGDAGGSVIVDEAGVKAAIYAAVPGAVADVDITLAADVALGLGAVAVADTSALAFTS